MRRQKKYSIALKLVDMRGGGYSNFLEQVKIDGTANSLAKFIIIDGDRAVADEGEKKKLRELVEYCILQNKNKRTPHFLIVNCPDFEYVACLHTPEYKNQSTAQYIVREMGYRNVEAFKADEKIYNVLNTGGNSSELLLESLKKNESFISNEYSVNKKQYEIMISTTVYNWDKLERKGSNINEFFGVINSFYIRKE